MLADFLDMESNLIVSLHIQSVDQIKAIKTVKRKITDLGQIQNRGTEKKPSVPGYDMDIIPSDLATYGAEAKKALAGFAEPERANVPRNLPGAEHG